MIDYIEKGEYLHKAIRNAGHFLRKHNGAWLSDNDVAVQAIIDTFDPLPDAKINKIEELKIEGLRQANLVYGDNVFASVSAIELLIDIDATYDRSVTPASRLIAVNGVINTFKTERAGINTMNSMVDIQNYDVTTDPAW